MQLEDGYTNMEGIKLTHRQGKKLTLDAMAEILCGFQSLHSSVA